MPCYNSSRHLEQAINSILEQTFTNFEFIIINDGSTDETHEIISGYKDIRIKYFHFKNNRGNYVARNYGLKMAKGNFICVMDADDIAYPNRLNIQYEYMLKNPKIGCLGSNADIIDKHGNCIDKINKPLIKGNRLATFFLMNNFMLHPSLMIRKAMLLKYELLYDTKYKYSSDFDFVGRCARHFSVINISDKLLQYRMHNTQISTNKKFEQKYYADCIRLARVNEFKIRLSDEQKKIYLKLMDNESSLTLNRDETGKALKILNRLLVNNEKLKLYQQNSLYHFFDYILSNKAT